MGFQIPWAVFQIPQGKNVGIFLESGFPCIGRGSSELLRSFSLSLFFLLFGYSRQPLQKEFESWDNTLLSTLWQNNHNRGFLKPSHRTNTFCWKSFLPSIICHSNKLSAKIQFYKMFLFFKTQNFQYYSDLHVLSWCETRFNLKHPITAWIAAQRLPTGCF